ncbi:type VI secretion system lipoprotein TssJ [Photorhabdus heterorhabditis]|uniref:Type VI secretion protein n=1 Tax=Photorhabdus heterorhabditis TaxID=880156 RepID=A0A5B0W9V6_9GAMM|nr:type VI secretion system lipoprotein TssJ [Photorhabdus heterorhabditis]KAA1183155.1 type VI secretion system lipoprotein TssJ [Photorhabdus heterorhabditis]KOY60526.1 type VI secretion protein [Photorhabdus heterorhabditis]MBS9444242.1 type VI secretion system lipoprotein TssJ [Photorhabdus heterorhabditis]
MAAINFKSVMMSSMVWLATAGLAGCGLTQSITDGTVAVTQSIFHKQVKTLHLDFNARSALNTNDAQMPLSTVVRVYQLKDNKAFERASYAELLQGDSEALKSDRLAQRDIRVAPKGSVMLDMPMEKAAKFVAVVGLFHTPDATNNDWRLVIKRDELDADKPRTIELGNGTVTLNPMKE